VVARRSGERRPQRLQLVRLPRRQVALQVQKGDVSANSTVRFEWGKCRLQRLQCVGLLRRQVPLHIGTQFSMSQVQQRWMLVLRLGSGAGRHAQQTTAALHEPCLVGKDLLLLPLAEIYVISLQP